MDQESTLEYLEAFSGVVSGEALSALVGRFAREMGYDYFGFTVIIPMSMQRPKVVIFNQCPDSWVELYTTTNLVARDPVIALARNQNLPIFWNRLDERARFLQQGCLDVMNMAAEFGLRNGVSIPLHGACGENGILSFITREAASTDLLLGSSPLLSWMANYIFDAAIRVVRGELCSGAETEESLTERETQCLFWASEGKTSAEIACILGIAERTVNFHLNQVTRKTGTMNRYQAIAKGVNQGLIRPNLELVSVTSYSSSVLLQ